MGDAVNFASHLLAPVATLDNLAEGRSFALLRFHSLLRKILRDACEAKTVAVPSKSGSLACVAAICCASGGKAGNRLLSYRRPAI
jgi:hypothetical protein